MSSLKFPFSYQNDVLHIEDVSAETLAQTFGTPCYVYSKQAIVKKAVEFQTAFKPYAPFICYAVKANPNLAILNQLSKLGFGFDIVGEGELARVLAAGGNLQQIIFSGTGKSAQEIERALSAGIYCFNIESAEELHCLAEIATTQQKVAPFAIRVNPDIPVATHPYITTSLKENKFGISADEAISLYQISLSHPFLNPIGISFHLGSQLFDAQPYRIALQQMLTLSSLLHEAGIKLSHVDIGGGFGIPYHEEQSPLTPQRLLASLAPLLKGTSLKLLIEPGRAIVGESGFLMTRVLYVKQTAEKRFAIVDAGMNDLLRPALYGAWHPIIPVHHHSNLTPLEYEIVGPVCETADWMGKERVLAIAAGSLLAICHTGAYGFTMSSNYNSRCRAAEIIVDGKDIFEVRARETLSELFSKEKVLPT